MNAAKNVEYWEKWEEIADWDDGDTYANNKILRDQRGKIHLLRSWLIVDGKRLPEGCDSAPEFFESRGIPYDVSRVGWAYVDREISMKEAIQKWLDFCAPETFLDHIVCK